MPIRAAILTVSDKGSRGERIDTAGPAVRDLLESIGAAVERYAIVPDERETIASELREWAGSGEIDLVVTAGGTGFAPRDVTPEATLDVVERLAPGLPEAMRAAGRAKTPMASLSRGIAGTRGLCLIVNVPGSERAARESLEAILPILEHAIITLRGEAGDHAPS